MSIFSKKVQGSMESSITKLAKVTRTAIYALVALALISSVFLWFMATLVSPSWIDASFPVDISTPIGLERSLWGLVPAMLPVLQFAMIFVTLAKLFGLYAEQLIFELDKFLVILKIYN